MSQYYPPVWFIIGFIVGIVVTSPEPQIAFGPLQLAAGVVIGVASLLIMLYLPVPRDTTPGSSDKPSWGFKNR